MGWVWYEQVTVDWETTVDWKICIWVEFFDFFVLHCFSVLGSASGWIAAAVLYYTKIAPICVKSQNQLCIVKFGIIQYLFNISLRKFFSPVSIGSDLLGSACGWIAAMLFCMSVFLSTFLQGLFWGLFSTFFKLKTVSIGADVLGSASGWIAAVLSPRPETQWQAVTRIRVQSLEFHLDHWLINSKVLGPRLSTHWQAVTHKNSSAGRREGRGSSFGVFSQWLVPCQGQS